MQTLFPEVSRWTVWEMSRQTCGTKTTETKQICLQECRQTGETGWSQMTMHWDHTGYWTVSTGLKKQLSSFILLLWSLVCIGGSSIIEMCHCSSWPLCRAAQYQERYFKTILCYIKKIEEILKARMELNKKKVIQTIHGLQEKNVVW